MHSAYDSLKAGLFEDAAKRGANSATMKFLSLIHLMGIAASIAEGDAASKRAARIKLAALIGRGRCILNAADLAARPRIGQQEMPPLDLAAPMHREPVQAQGGGVC